MTQKKQEYRVGVGASSLLLILVVLCLATLAILSYLSAATDEKFTLREAEMVTGAVAAEARAQEALALLDGLLAKDEAATAAAPALCAALTAAGFDAEAEADGAVRLTFDAGADRALIVRVLPETGAGYRGSEATSPSDSEGFAERTRDAAGGAGAGGARYRLIEHRVQSVLEETFDW